MLDNLDLTQKIGKKDYKHMMPDLQNRIYSLQKASWEAGIPVVMLFEGWDAAGKGECLRKLTGPLDPRGFKLHPIRAERASEKRHPWLWRFWLKLPARGEWALFNRSWYWRVLDERLEGLIPENAWRRAYRDILNFERSLAEDGHLILKFFLHISKQEQQQRLEKLVRRSSTAWRVTAQDWEHHRQYESWVQAYEDVFERTDTHWGPWTLVEATDLRFAQVKIYQTILSALEKQLGFTELALLTSQSPPAWVSSPVEAEASQGESEAPSGEHEIPEDAAVPLEALSLKAEDDPQEEDQRRIPAEETTSERSDNAPGE